MKRLQVLVLVTLLLISVSSSISPSLANIVVQDSWKELSPMHQARSGLSVIAVNNKIYALGGTINGFRNIVGTNEQYDPETNAWAYKVSMPTPRVYFAVAEYQNKIYCIGGVTGERLVDERSGFYTPIKSNAVEVYDTINDSWTTKQPMPKGGGIVTSQQINGQIYVIQSPYVYAYNPLNDTWIERDGLPIPKYSTVIDDKIFATDTHDVGFQPNSPYYGGVNSVQQVVTYDPTTNSLTHGSDASLGVDAGNVGATSGMNAPKRIYVMGVKSSTSPNIPVNQAYDPITDNWTIARPMPTIRTNFGIAVINDTLYAVGGLLKSYSYDSTGKYVTSADASPTNINEQYTPIGYGTIQPKITVLSPQFEVYNSSTIALDFSVNKPFIELSYSLDGKENVTVAGNTTIANLADGNHNLTIYAEDNFGNIGSQTANFSIDNPQTGILENTLIVTVILVAAIVFLIIGMLLFRRHRKTAKLDRLQIA